MTTTFPDVTISTDRLVLRPFEEEDVTALTEMMNDEHVTAWTGVPHPYTAADAQAWATRHSHAERTEGRGIVFAVTEFLTQRLVGIVHLQSTNWHTRATEVGYVTAPGPAARATPANPSWPSPNGSSATRGSSASNCAPPPTTPPRSRWPRRSAASARASCATRG